MKVMAAVCGIVIVVLGLWSTGHNPSEVQSAVEVLCLVGGLILCFLAVVIARLDGLAARLGAMAGGTPAEEPDDPPVLDGE